MRLAPRRVIQKGWLSFPRLRSQWAQADSPIIWYFLVFH